MGEIKTDLNSTMLPISVAKLTDKQWSDYLKRQEEYTEMIIDLTIKTMKRIDKELD